MQSPGQRPALIVPGASMRNLHVVRLGSTGEWKDQLAPLSLPSPVQRITPLAGGACVLMTNGVTLQLTLRD